MKLWRELVQLFITYWFQHLIKTHWYDHISINFILGTSMIARRKWDTSILMNQIPHQHTMYNTEPHSNEDERSTASSEVEKIRRAPWGYSPGWNWKKKRKMLAETIIWQYLYIYTVAILNVCFLYLTRNGRSLDFLIVELLYFNRLFLDKNNWH